MSDLQYCPHCNSYHPASTSMTGCMRAPMAVTSGRHIVPPSLFLDQIEYVTRAEADAMVAAEQKQAIKVAAALAAAISLLERGGKAAKKAAPSDKMFDQMLDDYRKALTDFRAAIRKGEAP